MLKITDLNLTKNVNETLPEITPREQPVNTAHQSQNRLKHRNPTA